MVQGREENGKLILAFSGTMDSTNAQEVEAQVQALRQAHPCGSLVLDCDQLPYSASAGLRVILRLKKEVDDTVLINVHPDLYNILEMTGFTEMMEVHKAYRTISVEHCEAIGKGANGMVYRIDPDTIVKVYLNPDALQDIHRERELARLAFVAGVPTAISYDVVRIASGGYGSVFELLNATSFAQLLLSGEKSLEEVADMSVRLLKLIHAKEAHADILPDMKQVALNWAEFVADYLPHELGRKLHTLIRAVPESAHLLHGDYHLKNIMLQNGESLLIDMDTLCHGHPIFELASMYNAYVGFGLVKPERRLSFFGFSYEICVAFWHKTLELYLGTRDEQIISSVEEKAKIIGLTRLLRREVRRDGLNREDGRQMIDACRAALTELLPRVDTLVF